MAYNRVVQILEEPDGIFSIRLPDRHTLVIDNLKRLIPAKHRNTDAGLGWQPELQVWRFPMDYQHDLTLLIERLAPEWKIRFVDVIEEL